MHATSTSNWILNNYQVLYQQDVDYPYLVILNTSLAINVRNPSNLYAFHEQSEREIMITEHIPVAVHNLHGDNVSQHYLDSGWIDITHLKDLLPLTIQVWLIKYS